MTTNRQAATKAAKVLSSKKGTRSQVVRQAAAKAAVAASKKSGRAVDPRVKKIAGS